MTGHLRRGWWWPRVVDGRVLETGQLRSGGCRQRSHVGGPVGPVVVRAGARGGAVSEGPGERE